VVSETYEELVFNEPTEAFWRRAGEQGSLPAPEPQLSCSAYVGAFNPQVQSALDLKIAVRWNSSQSQYQQA
jgi:hypothetical protein